MGLRWEDATLGSENRARLNELIKVVDYRQNSKFREYRFVGDLVPYYTQWLPIYKEGKPVLSKSSGKPVRIPFNVTNFNPDTGKTDDTKPCPFIEAAEKIAKYIKDEDELKQLRPSKGFYAQAINRKLQDNPDKKGKPSKEERASGFVSGMESDAFTPVEVHQLNYSIEQGLKTANELNTVKKGGEKVPKSIADPKYGADILIKYDNNEKGTAKYKVQKGERTPLDSEKGEDKLLLWDISSAIKETTLSRKEAKIEAERIVTEFMKSVKKGSSKNDSPEDDTDLPDDIESSPSPKKSSKDKKKGSSKKKEESPDADDSPEFDSSPESSPEDSPEVKKSSKDKKKTSKKKDSPEESPDLDSSPEDSPEVKKSSKDKKKTSKPSSKKKASPEEDEDDESPDFDLDESDDEDEDD